MKYRGTFTGYVVTGNLREKKDVKYLIRARYQNRYQPLKETLKALVVALPICKRPGQVVYGD